MGYEDPQLSRSLDVDVVDADGGLGDNPQIAGRDQNVAANWAAADRSPGERVRLSRHRNHLGLIVTLGRVPTSLAQDYLAAAALEQGCGVARRCKHEYLGHSAASFS